MANTTKQVLPYPLGAVAPFVHLDIKALAEAIDGRLITYCTESPDTRPTGAARFVGAFIGCTDTKAYGMWDGSVWRMFDTVPVQSTPTFSTTGSAPVMLAGNRKSYTMRKGAEITTRQTFKWSVLGGGEGLGDGFYLFSLPYGLAAGYAVDEPIGTAIVLDAGLSSFNCTACVWDTNRVYLNTNSGKVAHNTPLNPPSNSDSYFMNLRYFTD